MLALLRQTSIKFRIWLIMLLSLGGLSSLIAMHAWILNKDLNTALSHQQHTTLDTAIALADHYQTRVSQGQLTQAQAQTQLLTLLGQFGSAASGRVFVLDQQGVILDYPQQPERVGLDFIAPLAATGIALAEEAQQFRYQYIIPGQSQPETRIASLQGFAPWSWYLATEQSDLQLKQEFWQGVQTLLLLALGVMLVIAGLSFVVIRSIARPLDITRLAMREIAAGEGDLTAALDERGRDEISALARDFNRFVRKLREVVADVTCSAEQVAQAATCMAHSTHATEHAVQQQQLQTQTIASSMQQMTQQVDDISHHAQDAVAMAQSADAQAMQGKDMMQDAVHAMSTLSVNMSTTEDVVQALEYDVNQVNQVLDVIQSISEQTNLLALNAAIEAARAGSQGRGFAVVAEQVRGLAQRTQESISEIEDLIKHLQGCTRNVVTVVLDEKQTIQSTVGLIGQVKQALDSITASVTDINRLNGEIANAASEQTNAAQHINQGVNVITDLCVSNIDVAQDAANQSHTLSALATGAVAGSVGLAMVLGHWYLTVPKLKVSHLGRLNRVTIFSMVASLLSVVVICLLFRESLELADTPLFGPRGLFNIGTRVTVGLLLPLLFAWMAKESLRYGNTRSATGILYASTVMVLIGTALSINLQDAYGLPL